MLMVSSVARLSFLVTLIVVVQGCNSGPSAPSEVGQPVAAQPAPTLPGMTRLIGAVVEPDGQAVPGAVITWLYGGQPSTAVTDATGVYDLTFDSQPPEVVRLTVEKDGYEPTVLFVAAEGKAEVRRDLHLHRIQRVAAGVLVRLSIGPSDSRCGVVATDLDANSEKWPCRRLRFVPSSSGVLRISVKDEGASPKYRIQLAANPSDGNQSYFSTPADAGSEAVVDLLLLDTGGPFDPVLETRVVGWWDY